MTTFAGSMIATPGRYANRLQPLQRPHRRPPPPRRNRRPHPPRRRHHRHRRRLGTRRMGAPPHRPTTRPLRQLHRHHLPRSRDPRINRPLRLHRRTMRLRPPTRRVGHQHPSHVRRPDHRHHRAGRRTGRHESGQQRSRRRTRRTRNHTPPQPPPNTMTPKHTQHTQHARRDRRVRRVPSPGTTPRSVKPHASQRRRTLHPRAPTGQWRRRRGPAFRRDGGRARGYMRASRIRLNGVSVALRNLVKPASVKTSRSRASPAWAPRPRPTSWDSEFGVQMNVDPT